MDAIVLINNIKILDIDKIYLCKNTNAKYISLILSFNNEIKDKDFWNHLKNTESTIQITDKIIYNNFYILDIVINQYQINIIGGKNYDKC